MTWHNLGAGEYRWLNRPGDTPNELVLSVMDEISSHFDVVEMALVRSTPETSDRLYNELRKGREHYPSEMVLLWQESGCTAGEWIGEQEFALQIFGKPRSGQKKVVVVNSSRWIHYLGGRTRDRRY